MLGLNDLKLIESPPRLLFIQNMLQSMFASTLSQYTVPPTPAPAKLFDIRA